MNPRIAVCIIVVLSVAWTVEAFSHAELEECYDQDYCPTKSGSWCRFGCDCFEFTINYNSYTSTSRTKTDLTYNITYTCNSGYVKNIAISVEGLTCSSPSSYVTGRYTNFDVTKTNYQGWDVYLFTAKTTGWNKGETETFVIKGIDGRIPDDYYYAWQGCSSITTETFYVENPLYCQPMTTKKSITTSRLTTKKPLTTKALTTNPALTTKPLTTKPKTTKALTTDEDCDYTTRSITSKSLTTRQLTTDDITSKPLTTQPLTTKPLTTQALTTQPLTTQPLTTQALTSQPLTTQPLTTKPLTTQPVTSQPLTTQPLTTQAVTSQPLTTQPLTTQPLTTQAVTSQPLTTQPLTTQPLTTQPLTTQAVTSQPLTTQPLTTQPLTTQPLTTQPLTTQAVTSQPLTTQPLTTQPLTTQPLTTQPLTTQPLTTQPLTTQPLTTQPLTTQPLTTQELTTQPLTTQPLTTQPLTTQPLTTQPLTTQPLTTQPLTTQPLTTQELTTQPLTTQPLTTQPLTTQPLTTQPLTTQELTTQPLTTQELTTQPLTTAPLTTAELTTAPLTTAPLTTAPLTTAPLTTAPLTTQRLTTGRPPSLASPCFPFFEPDNCATWTFDLQGETVSFGDYSVISFNDLNGNTGDTEGRTAVRNNVNVGYGFSFGEKVNVNDSNTVSLMVGNNVYWGSGALLPGNSIMFIGGNLSAPSYLQSQKYNTYCANPSANTGCLDNEFDTVRSCYAEAVDTMVITPSSSSYSLLPGGEMSITCFDSEEPRNYINIDQADFNQITSYTVSNCYQNSQWVITVTGGGSSDVVFNGAPFPETNATTIYVVPGSRTVRVNVGVNGGLIAPDCTLVQSGGVIKGKVVVYSITFMVQMNVPCLEDDNTPPPPDTREGCYPFYEPSDCAGIYFNLAGYSANFQDYQVISFANFSGNTGDTEGRSAVRDFLDVGMGFSFGEKVEDFDRNPISLVVGRDGVWGSGSLLPEEAWMWVGGNMDSPSYLLDWKINSYCYGCTDSFFDAAKVCYDNRVNEYASHPPNGHAEIVPFTGGQLMLICDDSTAERYYFQIDTDVKNAARSYGMTNCNIYAQYVITLTGNSDVVFEGTEFPLTEGGAVFIIPGERLIHVSVGVQGGIIAPDATLIQTGGVVKGKVVAGNIPSVVQFNIPCTDQEGFTSSASTTLAPPVPLTTGEEIPLTTGEPAPLTTGEEVPLTTQGLTTSFFLPLTTRGLTTRRGASK